MFGFRIVTLDAGRLLVAGGCGNDVGKGQLRWTRKCSFS
jgi:hypothetical protein